MARAARSENKFVGIFGLRRLGAARRALMCSRWPARVARAAPRAGFSSSAAGCWAAARLGVWEPMPDEA
jgi:hypothetical protein